MAEKNQHSSGVGSFLSSFTQEQARQENTQQIVNIDIDRLIVNAQNFYGMREVDELAYKISVTNYVEPLTVTAAADDKFLLIAGHRRLAAWKKLLEQGVVTDRTLPCVIRKFEPLSFEGKDGEQVNFSSNQMAFIYLILSNMGQRKSRTLYEQMKEIHELEPIARAAYNDKLKNNNIKGSFRKYFAEEVLQMSSTVLQRKKTLEKMTKEVIDAIQDGTISETAAGELASLAPEQQDEYIEGLRAGIYTGKVASMKDEIRKLLHLPDEDEPEEEDDFIPPQDDSEDEDEEPDESTDDEPDVEPEDDDFEPPAGDAPESEPEPAPELPAPQDEPVSETPSAPANKDGFEILVHRIPLPQDMGDPQEEAEHWWAQVIQPIQAYIEDAKKQQAELEAAGNRTDAARWSVRIAVAIYRLAKLSEK